MRGIEVVFPEDPIEPDAILELRVELLEGFGARPLRRYVTGRRNEETKDRSAHSSTDCQATRFPRKDSCLIYPSR